MTAMSHPMLQWDKHAESDSPERRVMGYRVPSWQRPLVWTDDQKVRLLESVWLGLNIGTYAYSQNYDKPEFDGLLIDGQQRLNAIQEYLCDHFPVFGYKWSEITAIDRRFFESNHFHCFIIDSDDEDFLRNYYDMTNFGGTPHNPNQRATK